MSAFRGFADLHRSSRERPRSAEGGPAASHCVQVPEHDPKADLKSRVASNIPSVRSVVLRRGALFRRQLQAITDPELGQDMGRAGRGGFELLPPAANEDTEALHIFGLTRSPDLGP